MLLEERRRQLKAEFAKGIANREHINLILDVANASAEDDFRATLALADTKALRLLLAKLRRGQVVRQMYRGPLGTGCLTHFLLGFASNHDLLDYPYESQVLLDSTCRTVRAWDFERIDDDNVLRILEETIRERVRINKLENAAVRRSTARTVARVS